MYEQIKKATANFTRPCGLKRNGRSTRYLQPGMWDLEGKLMLRTRRTGRHIAAADYADRGGVEELAAGWELCDY